LFWISKGYRPYVTLEICCIQHGIFRGELPEEQEEYACPMCAVRSKVRWLN